MMPPVRRETLIWTARGMGAALGVGIVFGIASFALRAVNVLILLFLAILLASALEPFVGWLRSRVPLGRGVTILVVYAVFAAGVAWLAVLVLPAALQQADELANALPGLLDDARDWAATAPARGVPDQRSSAARRGRRAVQAGTAARPRRGASRPGSPWRSSSCRW